MFHTDKYARMAVENDVKDIGEDVNEHVRTISLAQNPILLA
jgi:hypothetical protein